MQNSIKCIRACDQVEQAQNFNNRNSLKAKAMSRRFISEQEIFSFWKRPSTVVVNAVFDSERKRNDLVDLPIEQRREIYDFLSGYNKKLFAFGDESESCVIISSLYPSSSLCVMLRFPFSVSL